eukprot:2863878-Rhodomonas_salina.1
MERITLRNRLEISSDFAPANTCSSSPWVGPYAPSVRHIAGRPTAYYYDTLRNQRSSPGTRGAVLRHLLVASSQYSVSVLTGTGMEVWLSSSYCGTQHGYDAPHAPTSRTRMGVHLIIPPYQSSRWHRIKSHTHLSHSADPHVSACTDKHMFQTLIAVQLWNIPPHILISAPAVCVQRQGRRAVSPCVGRGLSLIHI